MGAFFSMGGYAGFIWPCYLLTLGGMAWLASVSYTHLTLPTKRNV